MIRTRKKIRSLFSVILEEIAFFVTLMIDILFCYFCLIAESKLWQLLFMIGIIVVTLVLAALFFDLFYSEYVIRKSKKFLKFKSAITNLLRRKNNEF